MSSTTRLKKTIHTHLSTLVLERIEAANTAIASAIESRDSATKSTAGDKHETGRAMMQIELENSASQLKKAEALKVELARIDLEHEHSVVSFGSLVDTNEGPYFMSIGIGRVAIDHGDVFVISLASPIGQLLKGKKSGDTVVFQNRSILIQRIS